MAFEMVASNRYGINNDAARIIPQSARIFAEAVASYVNSGGCNRYWDKILPHIGNRLLTEIVPYDVRELAEHIFPTQSNGTRNRCCVGPIRAVMRHAYDRGWGPLMVYKSFREEPAKRKKAATQIWLHAFLRQADSGDGRHAHIGSLVMFMFQTGARISEALNLRWRNVDFMSRTALLEKTKTEKNSTRFLTSQMANRLMSQGISKHPDERVFRIADRHWANDCIRTICSLAQIDYKPSHTCGRHAFANNSLNLGADIKSTMDAGGWKSVTIFLGIYVHSRNAGRSVAEKMDVYQYESAI
ncbi:tyrosine-type recombinase/integrase [Rhizobium sp. SAFR-030]|uniref:tyrosine-type recombinase/integrase n=1 Tax=Rhizobium sp. SAFR-030 TaxID=3387277 RepID=UPI003F8041AF